MIMIGIDNNDSNAVPPFRDKRKTENRESGFWLSGRTGVSRFFATQTQGSKSLTGYGLFGFQSIGVVPIEVVLFE